jgi:CPA2 family monovalent cation:H+ antiporter-2
LAVFILKYPPQTVILTGVSLFQVGEFAFILSKVGIEYNLLSESSNQLFLSVSIVSMLLTPFVIIFSERIAYGVLKINFINKLQNEKKKPRQVVESELENHLVVIGLGVNGSNLVKASRFMKIPFIGVEFDAAQVKQFKKDDIPVIFGDAAEDHILESLSLTKARAVVIAISDREETKIILSKIRHISQSLYTIVRTRYIKDVEELHALGADEVIPEEYETSIEIFNRVLHNFLVPQEDIDSLTNALRSDDYLFFQKKFQPPKDYSLPEIQDFNITSLKVGTDSSKLFKKTIGELDIRNVHQINILAIKRHKNFINVVKPSDKICRGDILFVQGKQQNIDSFSQLIH